MVAPDDELNDATHIAGNSYGPSDLGEGSDPRLQTVSTDIDKDESLAFILKLKAKT